MSTNFKLRQSSLAIGILMAMSGSGAQATSYWGDNASGYICGDCDNSGGEVLELRAGNRAWVTLNSSGTTTITTTGGTYINGGLTNAGSLDAQNTIYNTSSNNGGAVKIDDAFTVVGATSITGATTITGATSINTSASNGNTAIGNAANTVTINGSANSMTAVGANTITGATNVVTATTSNTISATAANGSNTISAMGTNGVNNMTSNATTGTNNINGRTNNIGVTGISTNSIGNSNVLTSVTSTGGNAVSVVKNNSITADVTDAVRTTAGALMVVNDATAGMVVDANGKITAGTVIQSTASLTVTNSVGNTHGIVVQEDKTTVSGGTSSSSLTLADNGATFSNAQTGAPIQVHGVDDGTAAFDAVNVRQFASAIASVTAMANIPQVDQDKTFAYGVGVGAFMGRGALAAGATYRFTKNGVIKASVSSAFNASNSTTVGFGAAWSY